MLENTLWVEKYRPKTIDECILPPELKEYFKSIVESKDIPNLLLYGKAGCGKTTVAKALCEELGLDYLFINGSENGGIDTLRVTIRNFASTRALNGKIKTVIIDEADYLNATSFQPAFRSFIEEFSSNCRFVLTCNNKNKIIAPLHSRLTGVDFSLKNDDKPTIAKMFFKRVLQILKNENVEVNNDVVASIIQKYFPDFRKTINEFQRNCSDGKISDRILSQSSDVEVQELVKILKSKDWSAMRQWVADNMANHDAPTLFRSIYDNVIDKTDSAPHLVVLIGEYQYKSAFVMDQEVNFVAFLTEVLANVDIR